MHDWSYALRWGETKEMREKERKKERCEATHTEKGDAKAMRRAGNAEYEVLPMMKSWNVACGLDHHAVFFPPLSAPFQPPKPPFLHPCSGLCCLQRASLRSGEPHCSSRCTAPSSRHALRHALIVCSPCTKAVGHTRARDCYCPLRMRSGGHAAWGAVPLQTTSGQSMQQVPNWPLHTPVCGCAC